MSAFPEFTVYGLRRSIGWFSIHTLGCTQKSHSLISALLCHSDILQNDYERKSTGSSILITRREPKFSLSLQREKGGREEAWN